MMSNYGEEIAVVREALGLLDEQVVEMWSRVNG
jgi:hypothetical protein